MLELLFASTVLIICDFYSNDLGNNITHATIPDMPLYRNGLPRLDRLIQDSIGDDCLVFDSKTATTCRAERVVKSFQEISE